MRRQNTVFSQYWFMVLLYTEIDCEVNVPIRTLKLLQILGIYRQYLVP